MALIKKHAKVFSQRKRQDRYINKKCKDCNLVHKGNENKFYRKMQSLCLDCSRERQKKRTKAIKKRNVWNL